MKRRILILAALIFLSVFLGCAPSSGSQFNGQQAFNLTEDEIASIEKLKQNYKYFTYGISESTEAFYGENGEIRGFAVLLTDWLSNLIGIPFIPVITEWIDLFPSMVNGEIDFTGDLSLTPERQQTFAMTVISQRVLKYFTIEDSLSLSEIAETRPLRFVMFEGSITYDYVMATNVYDEFEVIFVSDIETAYETLKNGTADALLEESVYEAAFDYYGDVVVSDFLPLRYNPITLAAYNPELFPIINIVERVISESGTRRISELYELGEKEYLRHKFALNLNDEERAFLSARNGRPIPVVAEYYNYPISFFNRYEKEWQGIFIDVLNEVTNLTGLDFVIINSSTEPFPELLVHLEKGNAAILSELIPTRERQHRFLWPEIATMRDNYALLSKTSTPDVTLRGILNVRVGVPRGTAYAEMFYNWFPEHPHAIEYPTSNDALNALERDEVEMVILNQRRLLSLTNYHEFAGYKVNYVFDRYSESFFGFNKDETILLSIFNNAMEVMDLETIVDKWVRQTFDYKGKIAQAQRPWLIGASVLLFAFIILLFVLFQRKKYEGKRLEVLVKQRTVEVEAASKAKSHFLANMSHEIRTPMNAILGIAEIQLQKGTLNNDTKEALNKIHVSGDLLLGIINDILDLSKIEAGKLDLIVENYELASLINDSAQLNMMRIGGKDIVFDLEVDENLPAVLSGDELRVKQILNNILSNAFKYTEKGNVTLSITFDDLNDPFNVMLVFRVKDTGQGMSQEQVAKLFDEYSRFNQEANRTTEGTGLGMSITRNLVHMMGGEIHVESEIGKGSVFTIRLPQGKVEERVLGKELAENLTKFRANSSDHMKRLQITREPMPYGSVLVVDDVETNIYVAQGLLTPYGLKFDSAESGPAAIRKVENGNIYDIIFMDHMMPKMDGIEAVKIIRRKGYTSPIVALTANAIAGQAEIFLKNGFDDFISKPIDIRQLNAVLNKFIRDKQPPEVIEEARKQAEQKKEQLAETEQSQDVNKLIVESFLRDALKSLPVLKSILEEGAFKEEDIHTYIIHTHGLKSALANIEEKELATVAGNLERIGREKNIETIKTETPTFLSSLQILIEKLTPNEDEDIVAEDEDPALLREKLQIIRAACEEYEETDADHALRELDEKKWSKPTKELLKFINKELLHSNFEIIVEKIDGFLPDQP